MEIVKSTEVKVTEVKNDAGEVIRKDASIEVPRIEVKISSKI
jgi:hypothetical protein